MVIMYAPNKPPAWLKNRQRDQNKRRASKLTQSMDLSQTTLHSNIWSARVGHSEPVSQQALADMIGVSRKTVNAIETGNSQPSLLIALRLAKALDTPIDRLFRLE